MLPPEALATAGMGGARRAVMDTFVEGSRWVSHHNSAPSVTAHATGPQRVRPIDSTLRKAQYTAGTPIRIDGLLRIAEGVASLGVTQESLNIEWWNEPEPNAHQVELCREVIAADLGLEVNVFSDALLPGANRSMVGGFQRCVDQLLALGATQLAPGIPSVRTNQEESEVVRRLEVFATHIAALGASWTLTLADVGRRDFGHLARICRAALILGARRLDLMDSYSSMSPHAVEYFFARLRRRLPAGAWLTFHAHDDFGMATASAVIAALGGVSPDVAVNGVSYRCGFASLEQTCLSLEFLYGIETGVDLARVQDVSALVSRELAVPTSPLTPVVGEHAFLKHLPPEVLQCLEHGPRTFPPVSGCVHADVVGAPVRWVWDRLSTPTMARRLVELTGREVTEEAVRLAYATLCSTVEARSAYPTWLEQDEALAVVARALKGVHG